MPIRTIAVAVTSVGEAEWLIPAASDLATSLDAHLIVVRPAEPVVPYANAVAYDPVIVPELLDWQVEETSAIRAIFDQVTARSALAAEFRPQETGASGAERFLLEATRAADLAMIGRADRAGGPLAWRLKEQLVRQGGRPVLMLPPSPGLSRPVDHLLVGWSPTREATRAAHDALRLAAPGARIDLLTIGGGTSADLSFDARHDLAAAFDRLGFRTELVDRESPRGHAGEALLQTAFERGAELVVTGAFGHSRVYDFVIGAVTTHMMEESELPALLSK